MFKSLFQKKKRPCKHNYIHTCNLVKPNMYYESTEGFLVPITTRKYLCENCGDEVYDKLDKTLNYNYTLRNGKLYPNDKSNCKEEANIVNDLRERIQD